MDFRTSGDCLVLAKKKCVNKIMTMCGDDNDRIVTALMHVHIPFHCCLKRVNCANSTESEKDFEWLHN